MYNPVFSFGLIWILYGLFTFPFARAEFFVVNPSESTTCHAGQSCKVQWLDNGERPLLANMGPCYVGLYRGKQQLIQQLDPVDVSSVHSLDFTPQANAGPNSNTYYVAFTSVSLKQANSSRPYIGYSPNFTLDGMSGTLDTPIASLTSSIPIPPSISSQPSQPTNPASTLSGTITITISTQPASTFTPSSVTFPSLSSSASRFVTSSPTPSASASTASSSVPASGSTQSSAGYKVGIPGVLLLITITSILFLSN
ncbi:hypothetical protein OF83DRAFT_1124377 [Amylostereum chailletii]|nr:hypothetical protein OF83DRAFT_1124377 [Amylostereum chailletii]